MQFYAKLLQSCALLALSTGPFGMAESADNLQGLREEFRIEQEELRGELLIGLEDLKKENKALQVKLEDLRTKNQINLEKFELEMTKREDPRRKLQKNGLNMKQKKEVKKLIRKSTNKFENQCCSELDTVPPSLLLSSTPSQSESPSLSTPTSHQCFDDLGIVEAVSLYFSDRTQAEKEWGEIGTWRTCKVTDLSGWNSDGHRLFGNKESFNEGLDKWDVSSVTSLSYTFLAAKYFNQPLNEWDVSNSSSFYGTFVDACSFNQPLDQWDVSNSNSFAFTFYHAGFFNQPLNEWDVSNSSSFEGTFRYAGFFNQPLDQWDVSNSSTFSTTFYVATSFNQPLDEWDVSNSSSFYGTFVFTENFNQPCLKWSVNPDADVRNMFKDSDGKLC